MPHTLLLKNARLIDGLADQSQTGMSILVTGERISQVERGEIPLVAGEITRAGILYRHR